MRQVQTHFPTHTRTAKAAEEERDRKNEALIETAAKSSVKDAATIRDAEWQAYEGAGGDAKKVAERPKKSRIMPLGSRRSPTAMMKQIREIGDFLPRIRHTRIGT